MAHPRKEIRDAVATLLVDAETAADDRVVKTRVIPWRRQQLPAIAVYTDSDPVDPRSKTTSPRQYDRTVELVVEIGVLHTDALSADDALDALELEVLSALGVDPTLGEVCDDLFLAVSEPEFFADGDKVVGTLRMQFDVTYRQFVPADEDVDLPDDFDTANVRYNLGNEVHEDDQAEDNITDIYEE